MASAIYDPLVCRLKQTTNTLARANGILRSAFVNERTDGKSIAVDLPRRNVPTYLLPNNGVQPWELLPMKAAAMAAYPNFFNNSCTFFGSIKRDVANGVPFSLLRTTRLSIDLAKVVRNLGIVDGFEIVQRRQRLGPHDFVWTSDQPEPSDIYDVALYKYRLLRLHLRTDMFSLLPPTGTSAKPLPPLPPSAQLAPALGLLPLSVRNISKASRPVLMYPRQLEAARQSLSSGLFVCYHHELGITTDAVAELYDVPVLVAAHVGLPLSQVVQIRGALRLKAQEERGVPLKQVMPLKSWNMVQLLRERMVERQAQLQAEPAEAVEGSRAQAEEDGVAPAPAGPSLLQVQVQELQEEARREHKRASEQLSKALSVAQELEDGLLAWQVLRSGALEPRGGSGGSGSSSASRGVDNFKSSSNSSSRGSGSGRRGNIGGGGGGKRGGRSRDA